MKAIKYLLSLVLFIISLMTGFPQKSDKNNRWDMADNDTLYLVNPEEGAMLLPAITGSIYKAVNPRFIADINGITKSTFVLPERGKIVRKTFELIAFDYTIIPNYALTNFFTSLNASKRWNYYINDNLMHGYSRVLVSALMPQAIEKVEYDPSDSLIIVTAMLPPGTSPSEYKSQGSLRFYTRDISKSIIDDRTTLYLLNDQVITRKIFEAINPAFIRSLERITNNGELAKYKHENIREIVKIELFKKTEVVPSLLQFINCPECKIYLVDNIPMDFYTYEVLNRFYFKETLEISEDEESAFAPYKEMFPKTGNGGKQITIISL